MSQICIFCSYPSASDFATSALPATSTSPPTVATSDSTEDIALALDDPNVLATDSSSDREPLFGRHASEDSLDILEDTFSGDTAVADDARDGFSSRSSTPTMIDFRYDQDFDSRQVSVKNLPNHGLDQVLLLKRWTKRRHLDEDACSSTRNRSVSSACSLSSYSYNMQGRVPRMLDENIINGFGRFSSAPYIPRRGQTDASAQVINEWRVN